MFFCCFFFLHPRLINPNPTLRWAPNLQRTGRCFCTILPPASPLLHSRSNGENTRMWGMICCTSCFESEPWMALFSLTPVICHLRVLPAVAYPPSINAINSPLPSISLRHPYSPAIPGPPSFLPSFLLCFLPQSLRTGDGCSRRAFGYCSYLLNTIIGAQAANRSPSVARTLCLFFSFFVTLSAM